MKAVIALNLKSTLGGHSLDVAPRSSPGIVRCGWRRAMVIRSNKARRGQCRIPTRRPPPNLTPAAYAREMEISVPGLPGALLTAAPSCLDSASTMPVPSPAFASPGCVDMPMPVSRTDRVQAGPSER